VNCGKQLQKVHQLMNNYFLSPHDFFLDCGASSKAMIKPMFCNSLSQFAICNGLTTLSMCNFKLYTAHLNQLLNAGKNLVKLEIFDNELVDSKPIRMPPSEFSHKADIKVGRAESTANQRTVRELILRNNRIRSKSFKSLVDDLIGEAKDASSFGAPEYLENLQVFDFSGNFSSDKEEKFKEQLTLAHRNLFNKNKTKKRTGLVFSAK